MTTLNSFTRRTSKVASLKGALAAVALGIAGLTATTMISTTAAQAAPGWHGNGNGHGHGGPGHGNGGNGNGGHGPNWTRPGHGHGHHHHRPRPPRHWGPGYAAGILPFSLGIVSYTVQPECYVVRKKVHVPGVGRVLRPVTVCN